MSKDSGSSYSDRRRVMYFEMNRNIVHKDKKLTKSEFISVNPIIKKSENKDESVHID